MPVLPVVVSCPVPGGAGSGGCRESERLGAWESLERAFPALSRIIREPEGAWTPGRPRKAQEGPNRAKGARNRLKPGSPGYSPKRPETPYIYRYIQGL